MEIKILSSFDKWQLGYVIISGIISFVIAYFVIILTQKHDRKLFKETLKEESEKYYCELLIKVQEIFIDFLTENINSFYDMNTNEINNILMKIQKFILYYDTTKLNFLKLNNHNFDRIIDYLKHIN